MNVLSLFDGISCGQVALERAGIKVENYYASEIDKYAIAVTQYRYPKTSQEGNILGLRVGSLPKIDLLMGGSPCQGFSFAGKQLAFQDQRSKLFFEFMHILRVTNPKYFLLENVNMKKEYLDIITEYLGVEPIKINSSLVSAQNRIRYYWTNIPVEQPKDKGILLKDVLEDGIHEKTGLYHLPHGFKQEKYEETTKYPSLHAQSPGNNHLIQVGEADLKGHESIKRVYSPDGKAPTVTTMGGGNREPKIALDKNKWRKLTPLECERLQTLPDNYTFIPWQKRMMSNTQRYKMIGNGWTVDVIAHILGGIK